MREGVREGERKTYECIPKREGGETARVGEAGEGTSEREERQ